MKNIVAILAFTLSVVLASCSGDNGPKGLAYFPEKTTDEMMEDIVDAANDDGWVYEYDVDLHKREDGEWVYAGRYGVYMSLDDNDECNLWIDFGNPYKMPVYYTEDYGYTHKVQYQGEWYYF